jgi:hypothetical protein
MASEQFSQAVRGSGGQPIATSAIGSIDTNDYGSGGGYDEDGSSYPYSLNPAETIKELGFQIVDAEILVTITTVEGDVVEIPVASPSTYDRWDIDSVEITDPNGNTPRIAYWWAGE